MGVVIAAFSYLSRLYRPIERLAFIWSGLIRCIPVIEKVYELLEYAPPAPSNQLMPKGDVIELDHVSWRYETKQVLTDVNLQIKSEDKIAIVGQSGTGKSTIAWLLLGLFKPQKGQVLLDGNLVSDYNLDELIKFIGYTSAHPHIFQGTLRENITLGLEIDDCQITDILNVCGLSEMHLDKPVGEGFGDLSLGQKQRIGLARLMIRKPKIIILDEATSGIDSQIEEQIFEMILKMKSTLIVMSHRLSTIKHCSKVALLWQGQIQEVNSHEELLKSNENYRWIFDDQLNVS